MKNDLHHVPPVGHLPLPYGKRVLKHFAAKGIDGMSVKELIEAGKAINIWEPNKEDLDRAFIFHMCEAGYSIEAVLKLYKRRDNALSGARKYIVDLYNDAYQALEDAEVSIKRRRKTPERRDTYDDVPAVLALLHFVRILIETEDPLIVDGLKQGKFYYQLSMWNPDILKINTMNCCDIVSAYGSRENVLWPDLLTVRRSVRKARRDQEPWYLGKDHRFTYIHYGIRRNYSAELFNRRLLIHMGYWTDKDSLVRDILFAKKED